MNIFPKKNHLKKQKARSKTINKRSYALKNSETSNTKTQDCAAPPASPHEWCETICRSCRSGPTTPNPQNFAGESGFLQQPHRQTAGSWPPLSGLQQKYMKVNFLIVLGLACKV